MIQFCVRQLFEAGLETGLNRRQIQVNGLKYAVAVAVDWITGNLYILDSGSKRIDLITTIGQQKVIYHNLINPMDIAVDPTSGLVYY